MYGVITSHEKDRAVKVCGYSFCWASASEGSSMNKATFDITDRVSSEDKVIIKTTMIVRVGGTPTLLLLLFLRHTQISTLEWLCLPA